MGKDLCWQHDSLSIGNNTRKTFDFWEFFVCFEVQVALNIATNKKHVENLLNTVISGGGQNTDP